jgi:GntR family transcriptional regulator
LEAKAMVSRGLPVPLYYQLREILRAHIARGDWQPGQKIPSEAELCAHHRLSRITVRQAVKSLVNEGLLFCSQGRGTFVAGRRVSHVVSELVSFSEEMAQRGLAATSRLLEAKSERPVHRVRTALQLQDNEDAIRIRRLRLAGAEPMALQTAYLPGRRFSGIEAQIDDTSSLYRILETEYGVRLARAVEVYAPAVLKSSAARALQTTIGAPAFEVERTTFDTENRPVEFVMSILRGDRLQLTLELIRKRSAG